MDKRNSMIMIVISFIWLTLGTSCDKMEMSRFMERIDYAEKTGDSVIVEDSINICDDSGISFDLESDGLEEEIEDVYLHARE